jgi:DNA-binding transcriptional regulator YhcF (GntR family)
VASTRRSQRRALPGPAADQAAELFALAGPSGTPRFLQVAEAVQAALKAGRLKKGDRLPSINEACRRSGLARGTVVKAYARLQELRLIAPVHGMGYFVRAEAIDLRLRTLVVFDTLNGYKERLYAGLVDGVAGRADLDVWFHHFNPVLFRRLLLESAGRYDRYVVMPFRCPEAREGLAAIPPDQLLLLDVLGGAGTRQRSWIVQNFDEELVRALATGLERLRRYRKLFLVFPPEKQHQPEIPGAFLRFGRRHGFETAVLGRLNEGDVEAGAAYLVIEDDDLVNLVSWCQRRGHRLGRDVGIVSYNDTPLKRVVAGGISVVSTDFYAQGVRAAEHILAPGPRPVHEVRPTELTLRSSL